MSARLGRALTAAVLACTLSVLLFPLRASAVTGTGDLSRVAAGPPAAAGLAPEQPSLLQKPAKPPAVMAVTARSVRQGDLVTLSGGGFAPGAHVVISFHSAAIVVGSTNADDAGNFSVTVAVPAAATGGQHDFEAQGPGPAGAVTDIMAQIRVDGPGGGGAGSWVIPVVMILVTLLIAAGAWTAWSVLSGHRPLTPDH
jgi:hypothetical protein